MFQTEDLFDLDLTSGAPALFMQSCQVMAEPSERNIMGTSSSAPKRIKYERRDGETKVLAGEKKRGREREMEKNKC